MIFNVHLKLKSKNSYPRKHSGKQSWFYKSSSLYQYAYKTQTENRHEQVTFWSLLFNTVAVSHIALLKFKLMKTK